MMDEHIEFRVNPEEPEYPQFEGTGTVFEAWRKDEILGAMIAEFIGERTEQYRLNYKSFSWSG